MSYAEETEFIYVKTCEKCGGDNVRTTLTNTRKIGHVYRRKVCMDCGFKFSTVETTTTSTHMLSSLLSEVEELKLQKSDLEYRLEKIKKFVKDI